MFSKTLFLLTAAFVMAGCVSTDTPAVRDSALASITIPVFSEQWVDGNVQLATKNKQGCGAFSKNMLPAAYDKDFSIDIEGDRDIFFHISRTDAHIECDKVGMFYATKGNEYSLNLVTKDKQCEILLIEKTPDGVKNKIQTYSAFASIDDGIKVCGNKNKLY